MKYFIANWKANKNVAETKSWVDEFLKQNITNSEVKIIICPPFPLLAPLRGMLEKQPNISLGSQDISMIEGGTYTGEVTAYSLHSLAEYCILGHSERKKYFNETEESVKTKYTLSRKYGIEPILCVADSTFLYPADLKFLCYEPPQAISSGNGKGNNKPLESVLKAKKDLKVGNEMKFIYGGSVNKDNASEYLSSNEIDGFLIGGASLDPLHFSQIISLA